MKRVLPTYQGRQHWRALNRHNRHQKANCGGVVSGEPVEAMGRAAVPIRGPEATTA